MSIRMSLYDFFAYTIPGIFYLLIAAFALIAFGYVKLDWQFVTDLPLTVIFLFVGAGYVVGILIDVPAYKFQSWFYGPNASLRARALEDFRRLHPWLQPQFTADDFDILLRLHKLTSIESAFDIEMHNVASIMLRNIGLAFSLLALVFVVYFFLVSAYIGNLAIAALLVAFSILSIRRNALRRIWFYRGICDAIVANQLLDHTWVSIEAKSWVAPSPVIAAEETGTE